VQTFFSESEARHQRAAFCDIGADVGVERAAFAGKAAVLEGVAVARGRAAATGAAGWTESGRDEDALQMQHPIASFS
jgi:hypothetical protein